jgi:hypothetical protein
MNHDEMSKIFKRPWLSELILTTEVRPCERCKALTRWAKPRQTKRGYCAAHALDDGTPSFHAALSVVMAVFPETGVRAGGPEVMEPDEYAKREERVILHGRWAKSGKPFLDGRDQLAARRRPLRGLPANHPALRPGLPPVLQTMRGGEVNLVPMLGCAAFWVISCAVLMVAARARQL